MKSMKNIKSILVISVIGIISLFFINMSLAADTAKVKVETANLRENANENSKILELLSLNDKVEILEKNGEWYKVKVDGITGYLRKDLITLDETEQNTTNTKNNTNITVNTENKTNEENITSTENTVSQNTENVQKENTEENTTNTTQTTEEEQKVENTETQEQKTEQTKLGKHIITETSKLKIIPLINATNIIEVKKDEEVEVVEILNGWACVETQTTKGWIREEKLKTQEQIEQEKRQKEEQQQKELEKQKQEQEQKAVSKTLYVNTTTVNVRKEANTTSEIITTLAVNTEVKVVEEVSGWSKVEVNGKEGYISSSLLSTTKQETSRASTPRTKTQTNTANTSNKTTKTSNSNKETAKTQTTTTSVAGSGASVVAKAQSYIGSKYVYGGMSPSGFDCSGFTSYIYKQFGISLNRTAAGQYSNGTVVSKGQLQAGDLVMFGKSGISHVGIYVGGGMMVHAANPSRGVTTDSIYSGYYNSNYVGARRIIN